MDVLRWENEAFRQIDDELAQEEPLEIRVRGNAISATMRTPGHDAELAAGFLLTEGIIHGQQDVLRIEHCGRNEDGNDLNVLLAPEVPVDFQRLTRHVFASSSCGLCGKATIESIQCQFPQEVGGSNRELLVKTENSQARTGHPPLGQRE